MMAGFRSARLSIFCQSTLNLFIYMHRFNHFFVAAYLLVGLIASGNTSVFAQAYKGFNVGRYQGQVSNGGGKNTGKGTLDIRGISATGAVQAHIRDSDGLEGEGTLTGAINANGVMQLTGVMTAPSNGAQWQTALIAVILPSGELRMGNRQTQGSTVETETAVMTFTGGQPANNVTPKNTAPTNVARFPRPATGKKISQFEQAGYCDLLIDKAGRHHVVFQENPAIGKPVFIYYTTSADGGNNWSKPISLSNDETGNGAGYPRILQDGSGMFYAIWKRYGDTADQYPKPEELLDGPGGYAMGTVFYSVLNGGTWSRPIQINETQRTQNTWFATVTPQGIVAVFWAQLGPAAIQVGSLARYSYHCDYIRSAFLTGTTHSAISDFTKPWVPTQQYEQVPDKGYINLDGYVDAASKAHLVYETVSTDGVAHVGYLNGQTNTVAYTYPKYQNKNTFTNPAKLLVDEKGVDHLIFLPPSNMLESEQVWDINLSTHQKTIIFNFQDSGSHISGFQASQGPGGRMAVVVEANLKSLDNTEAYGCFYQNGAWQFGGLTNNASKDDFKMRDVRMSSGLIGYFASLTQYRSSFASVAWDAAGRRNMAMTLTARWIGSTVSVDSPSIVYVPIDR